MKRDVVRYICGIKTLSHLKHIEYNRGKSFQKLNGFCDFFYYGGKYFESYLIKFVQLYYILKRFNVDKRTSYLSNPIVSGQMDGGFALRELQKPFLGEVET